MTEIVFLSRYGVLGLGSSAYPNFCAFGIYLDQSLEKLGGKRIIRIGLCDELAQQQFCFKTWLGEFRQYDILREGDEGEDLGKKNIFSFCGQTN